MVPVPYYPDAVIPYQELRVMEQNRILALPKVVGNKVLDLSVTELLNGVDLEGTRKSHALKDFAASPLRLFYSYSHKDEDHQADLEIHLSLLRRKGLLGYWRLGAIAKSPQAKNGPAKSTKPSNAPISSCSSSAQTS
jgi:internalin A